MVKKTTPTKTSKKAAPKPKAKPDPLQMRLDQSAKDNGDEWASRELMNKAPKKYKKGGMVKGKKC